MQVSGVFINHSEPQRQATVVNMGYAWAQSQAEEVKRLIRQLNTRCHGMRTTVA
jgi:hypothetical protein